jgi:thiol-disulfide isomerase/thioredoxin
LLMAVLLPVVLLTTGACGQSGHEQNLPVEAQIEGSWRAVLASPGGELPFELEISQEEGSLQAVAITATERVPFSSVTVDGQQVELAFSWYDSEINAELAADGDTLTGTWRRTSPDSGNSTLPFAASRGKASRFRDPADTGVTTGAAQALPHVGGYWAVEFQDEDGSEPARGEFRQQDTTVTGTFLTPTGDYRYLEGSYEEGLLRLSTFDGAHAFLFHARAQEDGTLEGDFWSRDSYHATFTARQMDRAETVLPDAWELVGLTNDEHRFGFNFPDLNGQPVSLEDPRFADKVVLVNIFGSWCPNCNDEAPLLADWHRRYGPQGLEIVGLAYEFSGDPERDRTMVRRFAERYGLEYTLLLAGISDKAKAAATLPDLSAVIAYPTSIFIGRDGRVRKIHSGFNGPGTGVHHEELVQELENTLKTLLAEPV